MILSTVFITIALVVFLILNLRHDPTEVLRHRVNRLQVNLLRDWLESRRSEVRTELRSGLGTLQGEKSDTVDRIIDDGWTRVIEILAEKGMTRDGEAGSDGMTQAPAPIDMKHLEEMITRAVSEEQTPAPGRPIDVEIVGEEIEEVEVVSDDAVQFIDIAEILSRGTGSQEEIPVGRVQRQDDQTSMESLLMTRTTGILSGMDSPDEFQFEEESAFLRLVR